MSKYEHRKKHAYPHYTIMSDAENDYFTVIYEDRITAYKNSAQVFSYSCNEAVTGAVFDGSALLCTQTFDNRIYKIRADGGGSITGEIAGIVRGYASIAVLKFVSHTSWLVIEASEYESDLSRNTNCGEGKTVVLVYDLSTSEILFKLPMDYLTDMALPFPACEADFPSGKFFEAVLLGDGCDGTEYIEDGDGTSEVFLESISINPAEKAVKITDYLEIDSWYDSWDEAIHSGTKSLDKMRFPLFDKYMYYWLTESSNSLSAWGNYVVYYCEDLTGIIISCYQNGEVYRVFRLPAPYRGASLEGRDGVKLYYNEKTDILTILLDGKINRYRVFQKSSAKADGLNCYYDERDEDLKNDIRFINLLAEAVYDVECEPLREEK